MASTVAVLSLNRLVQHTGIFVKRIAFLKIPVNNIVRLFGVDMAGKAWVMMISLCIFGFRVALGCYIGASVVDDGFGCRIGKNLWCRFIDRDSTVFIDNSLPPQPAK
jgi:hypothetical protein